MAPLFWNRIAFFLFLFLNFLIGFWASRSIKSMRDYALANQSLGGGALAMTLFASLLDGHSMGIQRAYKVGLISLLSPLAFAISALLLGWLIYPRLVAFSSRYTLSEVMGDFYGPWGRYITFLLSFIFSFLVIFAELKALGNFSYMVGLSPSFFVFLVGGGITLYTAFGGVRSVAATDVFQFLLATLGFLLCAFFVIYKAGGPLSILSGLPKEAQLLDFWTIQGLKNYAMASFFWCFFPVLLISPPIIQRVLMTSDKNRVRDIFLAFSLIYPFFRFLMLLVGLSLWRFTPGTLPEAWNFSVMVKQLFPVPLFSFLFFMALISLVISTIDSFLNSLAIMAVRDLWGEGDDLGHLTIRRSRLLTLFFGFLATLCTMLPALKTFDVHGYAILIFSTLTIPFLFGVLGLKGSVRAFLGGMATFWIVFFMSFFLIQRGYLQLFVALFGVKKCTMVGYLFLQTRVPWVLGIVANFFVFLFLHYQSHGGFLWEPPKGWQRPKRYRFSFPFLQNPAAWAEKKVADGSWTNPHLFAFFLFLFHLIPYFPSIEGGRSLYLFVAIKGGGILLLIFLMIRRLWHRRLAHYFPLFYGITILYALPFSLNLLLLYDPQGSASFLIVAMGAMLLSVVVDYRSFLLAQVVGTFFAFLTHWLFFGALMHPQAMNGGGVMLLGIVFVFFVALFFLRQQESSKNRLFERFSLKESDQKDALSIYQENYFQILDVLDPKSSMMEVIGNALGRVRAHTPFLSEEMNQIEAAVQHFQAIALASKGWLPLHMHTLLLDDFIDRLFARQRTMAIDAPKIEAKIGSQSKKITGDIDYLLRMVGNSLGYLSEKLAQKEALSLFLLDAKIDYGLPLEKAFYPVDAWRLVIVGRGQVPPAQKLYAFEQKPDWAGNDQKKILEESHRIALAHYGVAHFFENSQGVAHQYVIPFDPRPLDPKIKELAKEDLSQKTRLDQRPEKKFIQALEKKKIKKIEQIKKAILVAKNAHFGQNRKSGMPYYTHPIAVAMHLLDYTQDPDLLIAALLHDVLEDTPYSAAQIRATFGERVADLVNQVTHGYSKAGRQIKLNKSKDLTHLFLEGDQSAQLIKVADRLHNMETIAHHRPKKRREIAEETLLFFVPMANHLGYKGLAQRLANLASKATA